MKIFHTIPQVYISLHLCWHFCFCSFIVCVRKKRFIYLKWNFKSYKKSDPNLNSQPDVSFILSPPSTSKVTSKQVRHSCYASFVLYFQVIIFKQKANDIYLPTPNQQGYLWQVFSIFWSHFFLFFTYHNQTR